MCNENKGCTNCIQEILEIILLLQENATCNDITLESCDKGFLGQCSNTLGYNTRPVLLVLCNGNLLSMPSDRNSTVQDSNVFRIEKLDKNCATFRVLTQTDTGYASTNSFFTITLGCICAIKCLADTFVDTI
ncbi:MAG: hypothetical protein II309_05625 [Bacilli bacterium]|jgi:hypothetical protein|nr:hypothetical protein [Bacilli bacterium]